MLRALHRTAALALLALSTTPASATWSIILVDTRTGEIAVGSCTCLASFDLRDNTPVLIPLVGAATAQSFVDSTGQNRVFIRDRLAQGLDPAQILTQLATFDSGHQTRQYGIADTRAGVVTFSGTGAGAYAGGLTGSFVSTYSGQPATIVYAIQGNVLTGAPVINQALAAATTTQGDLAAKLMAAMQAARAMGGDGRCSCNPSVPTACGSPPPSFTKSAHIGYMLIARAGDREGGNGLYRAGAAPLAVAAADVTGDGKPDLFVANSSATNFSFIANTTPPAMTLPFAGPLIPTFGPLPGTFNVAGNPRGIAIADVTGDTLPDVLTVDSNIGSVSVCRGLGAGSFAAPVAYPIGLTPRNIAIANLDGQPGLDIAAACATSSTVGLRFNDGAGAFPTSAAIPVDATPTDIVAANLIGSPALDLAVICRGTGRVVILAGDGAGGFTQAASIPCAPNPAALVAADFNNDGQTDLALACDGPGAVQVLLNDGAGGFAGPTLPLTFSAADLLAGDITGDNRPDLVATGGARFATLFNNGSGAFAVARTYTVAGILSGAALADLDGDGDLDLAAANNSLTAAMTVRNYGPGPLAGTFNDGLGTGTGDYYMNFNIANQLTTAPDPVIQLQAAYDQWRAGLAAHPDAVRSDVAIAPPYLPANGTSTATATITLRDWQGAAVTAPVSSVEVVHAPGSAGRCAIGPVQSLGNGVYTVILTAGTAPGLDRFQITARDPLRAVVLMPNPQLSLYPAGCYPDCDTSGPPAALSAADFACFLTRFAAADPYANCDQSTTPPTLNVADFTCYLQRFAAGCP